MQIIKIYSSLMNPMVEVGKLFDGINMMLKTEGEINEEFYHKAIQKILNKNQSITHTVRANWLYFLAKYPFAYRYIYPEYLKKEEEIIKETKKRVIQFYLARNTEVVARVCNDKEIMGLFAKDPKMTKSLYDAFASYILEDPNNYSTYCPSAIKTKENLLKFKDLAKHKL